MGDYEDGKRIYENRSRDRDIRRDINIRPRGRDREKDNNNNNYHYYRGDPPRHVKDKDLYERDKYERYDRKGDPKSYDKTYEKSYPPPSPPSSYRDRGSDYGNERDFVIKREDLTDRNDRRIRVDRVKPSLPSRSQDHRRDWNDERPLEREGRRFEIDREIIRDRDREKEKGRRPESEREIVRERDRDIDRGRRLEIDRQSIREREGERGRDHDRGSRVLPRVSDRERYNYTAEPYQPEGHRNERNRDFDTKKSERKLVIDRSKIKTRDRDSITKDQMNTDQEKVRPVSNGNNKERRIDESLDKHLNREGRDIKRPEKEAYDRKEKLSAKPEEDDDELSRSYKKDHERTSIILEKERTKYEKPIKDNYTDMDKERQISRGEKTKEFKGGEDYRKSHRVKEKDTEDPSRRYPNAPRQGRDEKSYRDKDLLSDQIYGNNTTTNRHRHPREQERRDRDWDRDRDQNTLHSNNASGGGGREKSYNREELIESDGWKDTKFENHRHSREMESREKEREIKNRRSTSNEKMPPRANNENNDIERNENHDRYRRQLSSTSNRFDNERTRSDRDKSTMSSTSSKYQESGGSSFTQEKRKEPFDKDDSFLPPRDKDREKRRTSGESTRIDSIPASDNKSIGYRKQEDEMKRDRLGDIRRERDGDMRERGRNRDHLESQAYNDREYHQRSSSKQKNFPSENFYDQSIHDRNFREIQDKPDRKEILKFDRGEVRDRFSARDRERDRDRDRDRMYEESDIPQKYYRREESSGHGIRGNRRGPPNSKEEIPYSDTPSDHRNNTFSLTRGRGNFSKKHYEGKAGYRDIRGNYSDYDVPEMDFPTKEGNSNKVPYGSSHSKGNDGQDKANIPEEETTASSPINEVDALNLERQKEEENLAKNLKRRKLDLKSRHQAYVTESLKEIPCIDRDKRNKELLLYKDRWISKAQEYDSLLSKAKIDLYGAMMKLTEDAMEIHSKVNQKRSVGKRGLTGNLKKKVEEIKRSQ